jgi:hypothetical protein
MAGRGAGWLLTAPVVIAVLLLVTTRAAIAAEAAEPVFIAEARSDGAASVSAWVSQDDVGGAFYVLIALSTSGMLGLLLVHALTRVITMARAGARREPRPAR